MNTSTYTPGFLNLRQRGSAVPTVGRPDFGTRPVKRAEDWLWGSLRSRLAGGGNALLAAPPLALPRNWRAAVNEPQTEAEVAAIRHSIQRGTPLAASAGRSARPGDWG